jgi:formamidopyrimidine-DNA glycosylase
LPELPEVETVVRDLRPYLQGKKIKKLYLQPGASKTLQGTIANFNKAVCNQKIISLERRAKYIILRLPVGFISVHLRMTGRLYGQRPQVKDLPFIRATFELSSGQKLYFQDVRRFGKIKYWPKSEPFEERLGVEPLSDQFTKEFLQQLLLKSSRQVKAFLLDQKSIVGLGNIYVDEALWRARIHPLRKTNNLNPKEIKDLWLAIRKVLQAGIDNCGTTFDSFYYGAEQMGKYAKLLKVFDRVGEKCQRCASEIIKIKVATRGTHICQKCQQ